MILISSNYLHKFFMKRIENLFKCELRCYSGYSMDIIRNEKRTEIMQKLTKTRSFLERTSVRLLVGSMMIEESSKKLKKETTKKMKFPNCF